MAQGDQFLPAVDRDQPTKFQIAFELFRFDSKIDNVRVRPNERVEWLNISRCRSILFATVNLDRAGFAELDCHNSRCRISAEKDSVFLKFHSKRFLDFARNDKL